jgi:hypothetical protein
MTSVFDGCDDSCGWTAAVVAALAYGSFGVPIKETTRLQRPLQVHPLVLQSYKTLTMFVLSWLVLPLLGVVPSFTPWGVLSGTLWVLGGTAGIYAIRKAGMAIAVGTWASIMIAVNFVWGILVFREPVHDMAGVALAFLLLAVGLVGMSYFAAPSASRENEEEDEEEGSSSSSLEAASDPTSSPPSSPDASPSSSFLELSAHDRRPSMLQVSNSRIHSQFMHRPSGQSLTTNESKHLSSEDVTLPSKPYRVLVDEYYESDDDRRLLSSQPRVPVLCHRVYSRFSERTLGIFGAVFNGLMTGSSLLPLHFAKHHGYGGANYMISFACGSLVANAGVWMVYAAYLVYSLPGHDVISAAATASRPSPLLTQAWSSLPPWHLRELGGPGCAAGALLTVAMFGSILSVTYLGQGIGNSVIQSKILIRYATKFIALTHAYQPRARFIILPCPYLAS